MTQLKNKIWYSVLRTENLKKKIKYSLETGQWFKITLFSLLLYNFEKGNKETQVNHILLNFFLKVIYKIYFLGRNDI